VTLSEYNKRLATDIEGLKKEAIAVGRATLNERIIGVPLDHRGRLTYWQLQALQTWLIDKFDYVSDDYQFDEADYWDTTVWMEAILLDRFTDDCDGFGYAVLGILYYVFNYQKKDLYRVACATETKEGHFVAWAVAAEGYTYQMENRSRYIRSVKYFKDLGYNYWYYSPMTKPNVWFDPTQKLGRLLVETPSNLAADKARFRIGKIFEVHKSKTLIKEWGSAVIGTVVSAGGFIMNHPTDLASTIQSNQHWFMQIFDAKTVGLIMIALSFSGLYLRAVTDKDVDIKRDIDD